jgi:uncharacterized protein YuzE
MKKTKRRFVEDDLLIQKPDLMECKSCRRVVKYNDTGFCNRCRHIELEKRRAMLKKKISKNKIDIFYFKEEDVLSFFFGPNLCDNLRELKNVNVLVDFDKQGNIVGLEIDGFGTALKESQREIEEIFKLADKQRKKKKKNEIKRRNTK